MSTNISQYPTLDLVNTVQALRLLSKNKLPLICNELRNYLLNSVSGSSGHLASGLGVVELTVALHYVYNTPFDNLIWDVGHQAYPHKILTGRREMINTIRQKNGLHPFPFREESEFDVLSVGHSSTSISAGLGMAVTAKYEQKNRRTACIIGDGAMTAGMTFEAMNHTGDLQADILVILNDNDMSISKNVGALNSYLARIISKNKRIKLLDNHCIVRSCLKKELTAETEIDFNGIFFKELGFNYIGPIDGHNVMVLIKVLKNIRNLKGPQLLHIITKKGKGYTPAEKDPIKWHAVPAFNLHTGTLPNDNSKITSYSIIFGNWLCEMAKNDPKLIAITPAMREGSGMHNFSKNYPKQYFDVAIAEQHAVTFAAGIAIGGYKPIVAIYSTFLQRAYDQLIHDVALQKLPVLFAIDRGGIVGEDGATHQGAFDIAFLRCIPGMMIMTPSDENECRHMLFTGYNYHNGPSAVRYPRGNITGTRLEPLKKLPIGKGIIKRNGKKIAILNFGTLLYEAMTVAEILNATLIDMRFVKPLDESLIISLVTNKNVLVTIEEGSVSGGAGSSVNELLAKSKKIVPVLNLGLPDQFIPHGNQREIHIEYQLDATGIHQQIMKWMNKKVFIINKIPGA
ncbi:1-deoxy-D-xylulose-5-phosphate synthase [Candidatus Ishikawella capsulata]|uniref:1-deoxy-D-xylulose-5-phosphate synthase n=1 Tax=Candidatus Ishikawaella capsulata Mpkobe TaxID=476281 RepID=C5WD00_9ENTR|nr:1-deoxy-D-xylulose-5-phosphate synthase [Candidatus Ishikawaella capsulata]BAH83206.1 1-deoxy-D-xylulose-5-phosphate synthase [Candidatus Ishikawaella capsulata Mpkobe]